MVNRFEAILRNQILCGELEKSINTEEYHNFPALPVFPDEKEDKKHLSKHLLPFLLQMRG
jgi:hypothetical protein